MNILFICVENSNRSQMAEAFARRHGKSSISAHSAGSAPSGKINPKAVKAMTEKNISLDGQRSKGLNELPDIIWDYAITMGCGDKCPTLKAKNRIDWELQDPRDLPPNEFNKIRDEIETRVIQLINSLQIPATGCCSPDTTAVNNSVKNYYGTAAQTVAATSSCCSATSPSQIAKDFISGDIYNEEELEGLPLATVLASFGCGNPTALAQLEEGEIVLDLGSGAGIDVLLSAKRVGKTGFVYGLDMTDEMLALAEQNAVEAGMSNVKFLKGNIEQIPLPDNSVNVIISNCVINLSLDKDKVLQEAFRVLKPGGRFAVSDTVTEGEIPSVLSNDMKAWSGCISGALPIDVYKEKLQSAGFENISITSTRVHSLKDMINSGYTQVSKLSKTEQESLDKKFQSAFIHASKPSSEKEF